MEPFYLELKRLRESQDIDLEEIHNRTKINKEYLEDIEAGRFESLPLTYQRLFLKAYVKEIGGDPDVALEKLEQYLGNAEETISPPAEPPAPEKSFEEQPQTRTPRKLRSDLVKGLIFGAVFLIIIFIIQKINREDSQAINGGNIPVLLNDVEPVSLEDLTHEYDEQTNRTNKFNASAPYAVKIVTTRRVWYRVSGPHREPLEEIIPAGNNRIYAFPTELELLFNHTTGMSVYLNGTAVKEVGGYAHPVRVRFSTGPKQVNIQRFTPKS